MGERDKQNKHAYDKVTAEGKGEKYSSTKKSSRQAMLQFLRKCLKPCMYEQISKRQYIYSDSRFLLFFVPIWA